jgi:hypothetical protein
MIESPTDAPKEKAAGRVLTTQAAQDSLQPDFTTVVQGVVPISPAKLQDMKFPLAVYPSFFETYPTRQGDFTFDEVEGLVLNSGKPFLTDDKRFGPYFTGPMKSAPLVCKTREKAIAAGKTGDDLIGVMRSASHTLGGAVFKHDLDDVPEDEFAKSVRAIAASGLAFIVYSTFKHGIKAGLVRARVLTFGDRLANPEEFKTVSEAIGLKLLGRTYDESEHQSCQLAGIWVCPRDRANRAVKIVRRGGLVAIDAMLAMAATRAPRGGIFKVPGAGVVALPELPEHIKARMHSGANTANDALGTRKDWGGSLDELRSALWAVNPDDQATWSAVAYDLYPLEDIGLALFLEWSEKCDTNGKWDRDAAIEKWNDKASTWRPEDGTGRVAAIFDKARENGWKGCAKPERSEGNRGICGGVVLQNLGEVEMEKIDWLWGGFLAKGKFHLVAGHAGVSKTTLVLAMVATVTKGGKWPDGTRAEIGNVLFWTGEDDIADTIKPRLVVNGADSERVFSVAGAKDESGQPRPFDPATDMPTLKAAAMGMPGGVSMLIVDPVVSAVSGDSHKNSEVRRDLQALVDLGAELNCVVIGITHLSKGTKGTRVGERITGSLAFNALARVVMGCAQMPEDDCEAGRVAFFRSKSNIGPDTGGFYYDIDQVPVEGTDDIHATKIIWRGPIQEHADEIMARSEAAGERSISKKHAASDYLRECLSRGPLKAKDIIAEAERLGFKGGTLQRAKADARVIDSRWGFGAKSLVWWRRMDIPLPPDWDRRRTEWVQKHGDKDYPENVPE